MAARNVASFLSTSLINFDLQPLADGPAHATEGSRQSTFTTNLQQQQREQQPQQQQQQQQVPDINASSATGLVTATPAIVTAEADEPFSSMVTQLGGARSRQLLGGGSQPPAQVVAAAAAATEAENSRQQTSRRRDQVGNRESNSSSGKEREGKETIFGNRVRIRREVIITYVKYEQLLLLFRLDQG